MERFTQDAAHVYLACGATDFRKQIQWLLKGLEIEQKKAERTA